MNGFKIILILCLIKVVACAELLTQLEDHLEAHLGDDILDEANRFFNGKLSTFSFTGMRETTIRGYLDDLSKLKKVNYCDSYLISSNRRVIEFEKHLKPNGKLAKLARSIIESQYGFCERWMRLEMEDREYKIQKVGKIVEALAAGVEGLCKNVDQTGPLWQYDCMHKIKSIDVKKSYTIFKNLLIELEGENFEKHTDTKNVLGVVTTYVRSFFKNRFINTCNSLEIQPSTGRKNVDVVEHLKLYKETLGKVPDEKIDDLLIKITGSLTLCKFFTNSFKNDVAGLIVKDVYVHPSKKV